jgi:carboxypeptidase D
MAALQLCNRTLNGWKLPAGNRKVGMDLGGSGLATASRDEISVTGSTG